MTQGARNGRACVRAFVRRPPSVAVSVDGAFVVRDERGGWFSVHRRRGVQGGETPTKS